VRLFVLIAAAVLSLHLPSSGDLVVSARGDTVYGGIEAETDSAVTFDGPEGVADISWDSVRSSALDERRLLKKIRVGLFENDVHLFRGGSEKRLKYAMEIRVGDSIVTGEEGKLELYVYKNDIVRVDKKTSLKVQTFLLNKRDKLFSRVFFLSRGGVVCLIRQDTREVLPMDIKTPGAAISAAASMIAVHYVEKGKTTIVDISDKQGSVGFRPTRMEIGEVVLKEYETAVLNEMAGTITEDKIYPAALERLQKLSSVMGKKGVMTISYPKKPLPKKWIYAGAGALGAGTLAAILIVTGGSSEKKADLTSVKVKW